MEAELVHRAGVKFEPIPAAGLHGVGWRVFPRNVLQLAKGYTAARRIVRSYRPDVQLFTGGYIAVPVALAGKGIPSLLYIPDIEPGLALKTLARFASCIAVTAEDSRSYFPGDRRLVVTGYPTRHDLGLWDREKACQVLDLVVDIPTLLVFGGSRGAQSINQAVLAILPSLLAEMQVVHISGQLDWSRVQAAQSELDDVQKARYRAYAYLHDEMGAALAAADLVVARAGASTLGEFPLFGLPAILVPYPYAWRYQQVNAQYLARHGAAVVLQDADMQQQLLPVVFELIHNPQRRDDMRAAMRSLAQPQAAESIAALLAKLSTRSGGERMAPWSA
jgi:UDP-N-acetylglucosamine--N-acetylmuramyl-(pentapeptide) pyrophosphoryl-undecaprenol N-acetylglucosamine transferase